MFPITQAKPKHLSDIYTMIIELVRIENFQDKIKVTKAQLGNLLFCDRPNHFVGMALIEEKLAGLVMFNFTNNNICINVTLGTYIENLYVNPESCKQGIGSSLFNYVVHKAQLNECSRIKW